MTTFNLTNSATEVDTAIQSVVGADTLPSSGSANMVTSQGVFNHIVTELGPFKGKTLTTESTGIAATDNDTSIPTSAAVKDYVDTFSSSTTTLTRTSALSASINTPAVATIGSIPSGVYGWTIDYQYFNNQFQALKGEFIIKVGNQKIVDTLVPSSYSSFTDAISNPNNLVPQLNVMDLAGGSVELKVVRTSTYSNSATVQIRNFTIKFVKVA